MGLSRLLSLIILSALIALPLATWETSVRIAGKIESTVDEPKDRAPVYHAAADAEMIDFIGLVYEKAVASRFQAAERIAAALPDKKPAGRQAEIIPYKASVSSEFRLFGPPRLESVYDVYIEQASMAHGVSPALVKAVIHVESNFHAHLVSSAGAVGLMQIMPTTARGLGAGNIRDPRANIMAGVKFLKLLLDMFDGNVKLAAAAYNSGPGAVQRYGGVPPFGETKAYVARVMIYYRSYLKAAQRKKQGG